MAIECGSIEINQPICKDCATVWENSEVLPTLGVVNWRNLATISLEAIVSCKLYVPVDGC